MLATLQETLTFVQNLKESINTDHLVNMCEIKQTWQDLITKANLTESQQKDQVAESLSSVVEQLSRMYVNTQLEMSLYKQAISSRGSDAQMMLKASIEDMLALKAEN